jgi:VanZ family protein
MIFALSSVPGSNVPGRFGPIAHFVEYAVLAVLLFRALERGRSIRSALLMAVALASAYGLTDELHQRFVPLRVSDPVDWLVDTAGAALGVLAYLAVRQLVRARYDRTIAR